MSIDLKIIEKRAGDEPVIARLLAESFIDKYSVICGDAGKAVSIISEEMAWRGADGNLFVALRGDEIVGSVELIGKDFGCLTDEKLVNNYLKHLGVGRGARALYLLSLLGRAVDAEEACVSQLSVKESERRRGVARALLARAARFAIDLGKSRLMLWVTAKNIPALKLYESENFVVADETESENLKRFFGCGSWLKLVKDLSK